MDTNDPLYIILFFILSTYYLFFGHLSITKFALSFLFIGGIDHYEDPILFSGWSLFYEMIFYILISLLISKKQLVMILLFIMGISSLLFSFENFLGYFSNQFYLYFLLGIILQTYEMKISKFGIFKFIKFNFYFSIILMLIVMLFNDFGPISVKSFIPRTQIFVFNYYIPRIIFWGIPTYYFIISFLNFFRNKKRIIILDFFGKISYSIYLIHSLLYLILMPLFQQYSEFLNNNYILKTALYIIPFVLIVPFSYLTYILIEIKLSNKLTEYFFLKSAKNINA